MRNTGYLVLGALLALAAVAIAAAADPGNTNNAPTEAWVFDSGSHVTIKNKVWDIGYTITIMNGSMLTLDNCEWTFESEDPYNPVMFIYVDVNSSLELLTCVFDATDGYSGYYIECHGTLKITYSELTDMVPNPMVEGGIACYDSDVLIEFADIHDNWMGDTLFLKNSQVKIANSQIHDCAEDAIRIFAGDNEFNKTYNCSIFDSEVWASENNGIVLSAWTNYGNAVLNVFNTKVHDTGADAFAIDVGDHTSYDNGNGSVYVNLDQVDIYNVTDQAMYTSSLYQVQGATGQNMYNVTLNNCSIHNVTNTGFYVQLVYGVCNYNLMLYDTTFTDISVRPSFDRVGAIWWWFQLSSGSANLWSVNNTFDHCNPPMYIWDYGSNYFYFYGCEFMRNIQDCIFDQIQNGASQSSMYIEGCNFHDNEGYAVRTEVIYMWQGGGTPITVVNSTFARNGLPSLAVTTVGYEYSSNVGFNVEGCTIEDQTAYAISISAYYPEGPLVAHLNNTRINNTAGIYVGFNYGYGWQSQPTCDVMLINSSIENSTGTALMLKAIVSYYSAKTMLVMMNSTISTAGGDGVSILMDRADQYGKGTGNFDSDIVISNCLIEKVNGIGLTMMVGDVAETGKRAFSMEHLQIFDAQRGVFNMGFLGDMYYCEIKNTLKEDILQIGAKSTLYYCKFTNIADLEFKAMSGGELIFIYDLQIYVLWDTGAPALGANVQLMDNTEKIIAVYTVTNSTGALPVFTMTPYFVRETGIFSQSPYVINASFLQVSRTIGVRLDYNKVITIIVEDHFEPEIFILYPKENHIQQSTTLQVRGSAWDAQSGVRIVQVSLDGVEWVNATGTLSWRVTFDVSAELIGRFSGVFNLRARALDQADNERVAMVLIRIDPTPPQLTVDFPHNGYITNNPEIWVRGVTEIGSKVEINSVPIELVVSMFTQKVTLVEGPNTISVISIDPLGNIQIERLTVYLDTQKPYVILTSPEAEGAKTNQPFIEVIAQLEEALDITINGHKIPYNTSAYPKGTGLLTYTLMLEPGDNVLVLQALDLADNLLIIERTITYDTTPPWIQVISPLPGARLARPEITVVGTVEPGATLLIADEDVTVQNGYFERTILGLEGKNEITFNATDAAGNVYLETLVVYVDTGLPVVTITAPTAGQTIVKGTRIFINGTCAILQQGVEVKTATSVLLNGLPYTVIDDGTGQQVRVTITMAQNGSFSIPVDLLEGKNVFTVTVEDEVGNRATESRTIRLDTHAPTLVVYIDPVTREKGVLTSTSQTVNITGYTDPGSVLTVMDILVPIADDGTFVMPYVLNPRDQKTNIEIESVDVAGNVRLIEQEITFVPIDTTTEKEGNWGLWFLVASLVVLIVVGIVSAYVVRSRRDEWLEMEAARATPTAPAADLETVTPEDKLPGPEELGEKKEPPKGPEGPAPTTAPARPRPRSPQQARRAAPARPAAPKPEGPEAEAKELSEKGAESDMGADETDQEGL